MSTNENRLIDRGGAAIAVAFFVLILVCVKAQPAHAAGCANEAIRTAQGAAALALPDCRAYELVTPGSTPFISSPEGSTPSAPAIGRGFGDRASTDGNGLAYFTRYPAETALRGDPFYLATRGPSGWSVEDAAPQDSPLSSKAFDCEQGVDFSADLSESILADGWNSEEAGEPGYCRESEETLVPGAPRGNGNLFLREGGAGTPYKLINVTPAGARPANAVLRGYTSDLSRILFEEAAPLTEGAPSETALYEWSEGRLHLISVLPSGEPVAGKLAFAKGHGAIVNLAPITHAYSGDGEDIFFYAKGNLYLRKNATQPPTSGGTCSVVEPERACTIQIDLKQGGVGASGGGIFWDATADGSRVFFSDESKLTADSNGAVEKPDLYEYNLASGLLTDRTHTAGGEHPDVRGFSGLSEDGSVMYFVAEGVLAGVAANSEGQVAQPLSPNLYLLDGGEITFVATLKRGVNPAGDDSDWEGGHGTLQTGTSPSGRYLAFVSVANLTSNASGAEVYIYDAQEKRIQCVSCTGQPGGSATLSEPQIFTERTEGWPAYLPRQVFDDGRVFFATTSALVSRDVNGAADVYEYQGGQVQLISSGTATGESVFFDADPSGTNVFFATPQALVPSDTNNAMSVYDARVDGGFSEPPPAPACEGEGCRGQGSAAPNPATPATANFASAEEGPRHAPTVQCKHGLVKRQGKCVKKPQQRKHHAKNNSQKKKHHKGGKHSSSKRRNAK
jgi:hypothetical protein